MGLLIECPECRRRTGAKAKACRCGADLARRPGKVYWIDYLENGGERRRERIGPSKEAAEHRLREVLTARAEGRVIRKCPDAVTRFQALAAWYVELPEVQAKRSYGRDLDSLKRLLPTFGKLWLKDITPALVEAYRRRRLEVVKPSTVNREIACLKTIFGKAIKNGKAERHPAQAVKQLKEHNGRERLLSPEEYVVLLAHLPAHIRPIVKLAYHTAMRRGEILSLTWGQVDLREGFITLRHGDTKTDEAREIPLSPELVQMFKALPRGLPAARVFTRGGRPIASIREGFSAACAKTGIMDLTFHDLRHTAINNWRLQGHDYFRIMAASGHKTMTVFKRYNKVSREELKALVGAQ